MVVKRIKYLFIILYFVSIVLLVTIGTIRTRIGQDSSAVSIAYWQVLVGLVLLVKKYKITGKVIFGSGLFLYLVAIPFVLTNLVSLSELMTSVAFMLLMVGVFKAIFESR